MDKFKIIIAGGRYFNNYPLLRDKCDYFLQKYLKIPFLERVNKVQIISGGAKGADTLGEVYATHSGFDKRVFEADWRNLDTTPCLIRYNSYKQPYNALAGNIRNTQMGNYADALIAFWDNKSKGTKDMINYMKKLDKRVRVVYY